MYLKKKNIGALLDHNQDFKVEMELSLPRCYLFYAIFDDIDEKKKPQAATSMTQHFALWEPDDEVPVQFAAQPIWETKLSKLG